MMRAMLDTDQPHLMLTSTYPRAAIGATYADLVDDTMLKQLEAQWPQIVLIDRGLGDKTGRASVLDIEKGTVGPADFPEWYDRQHKAGVKHLTAYANQTTMPTVQTAAGDRTFFRWYARLDGYGWIPGYTPGLRPAAIQTTPSAWLGFHADLSLVFEDDWHPQPTPTPPPSSVVPAVKTAADQAASLAGEMAALAALLQKTAAT